MTNELWELLESLGYEVYPQGSFTNSEQYPDHFFTIWNDETSPLDFYDNIEMNYIWYFTINFYSVNPKLATDAILEAKRLLVQNGWTVSGKGKDAYSASKHHTGRSIEAWKIEGGLKNG